jgi:adenine-specific DNA-methyltransferase
MTVITPRSYCSGAYFRVFRKWFFKYMKPVKIHIFESRKKIFKRYNVLQEMLILTAVKSFEAPEKIQVTTSIGETVEIENLVKRNSAYQNIITEDNDDIIIKIPLSELDEHIITEFDKFNFNLNTLGFKVSTGPVVPFRAKDYLLSNIRGLRNVVPLIWMQNIINGKIVWPIPIKDKNITIVSDKSSQKLLIPKGNYVLVKRLSSKEGKQRISAGVLLAETLSSDFIGIENHLNYIHKADGIFTEYEAYGIAALLNSKLYNRYFQMINGNTQINATEIMNLPLPSLETIKRVGKLIKKDEENNEIKNEAIVANELNINEKITAALLR